MFGGIALLRHASHPLLLVLSHLYQPGNGCPCNFYSFSLLHALQVLDLVELHTDFVQGQEGIFFDQPTNMLQSFEGQPFVRSPFAQIVLDYPIVEGRIFEPFFVEILDHVGLDVELLRELLKSNDWSGVVRMV